MANREKYKNPRHYVKEAVKQTLDVELKKNGESVPKDLLEQQADNILTKYEQNVVLDKHSYCQVIIDGFLTNFLWWLSVVLISVVAYVANNESIKTALRDFLLNN